MGGRTYSVNFPTFGLQPKASVVEKIGKLSPITVSFELNVVYNTYELFVESPLSL